MPQSRASKASDAPIVTFETIKPERIASLNAIYRRRDPLDITIANEVVTLVASWPAQASSEAQGAIQFTLGGSHGALAIPKVLVEHWLALADPQGRPEELTPQHRAFLLEAFLSDEIEWLENKLGSHIELITVESQAGEIDGASFDFKLTAETGEGVARLALTDLDVAVRLGILFDDAASEIGADLDLTVPVVILRGAALIEAGQLSELNPGDVILIDEAEGEAPSALIIVGNRFVSPVHVGGGGAHLNERLRRLGNSKWEWIMNRTAEAGDALEDADFDELPVALVFEIGRASLALGDLKKLAPGSVIPFKETTSEIVEVVANGKRIGRGEIVQIGESVGVRLVRVFDHA